MYASISEYAIVLATITFTWASAQHAPLTISKMQPEVTIENGRIRGVYKTSRAGRLFASFTKIPYAQPPIGELRFKSPVSADAWNTTLDATQEVPKCIQKDYISRSKPEIEGVEDCLFINVYTPHDALTVKSPSQLLPVMVFIHWGGNLAGGSLAGYLGPEYILDNKVLLVTFNYRLGVFGFFSTLNDDAPGNYGAKDQVAALRWVQANIAHFGGDPKRVTIFGQSAGAGAVHHLMLSPSGRGLFQRAISQSGAALCAWAKPYNEVQQAVYPAIGMFTNCEHADTAMMVRCLREMDAATLLDHIDAFKYFDRDPITPFMYVIETRSDANPEPFLERDPAEIIQSGDFSRVPWIIGVAKDEGALKSAPLLINKKVREELISRFDEVMPLNLGLAYSVPKHHVEAFWKEMKEFYLDADNIDLDKPSTIDGLTDMYSDRIFNFGAYQSALYHAMQGHGPIWFYKFQYRGSLSYANTVFVSDTDDVLDYDFGVSHCDDLIYLFNSPELFPNHTLNATDLQMSRAMVNLWTNFAINGNPHKQWQPLPKITGGTAKNSDLHYLEIRGPRNMALRNDFRRKFMKFWTDSGIFETIEGIH